MLNEVEKQLQNERKKLLDFINNLSKEELQEFLSTLPESEVKYIREQLNYIQDTDFILKSETPKEQKVQAFKKVFNPNFKNPYYSKIDAFGSPKAAKINGVKPPVWEGLQIDDKYRKIIDCLCNDGTGSYFYNISGSNLYGRYLIDSDIAKDIAIKIGIPKDEYIYPENQDKIFQYYTNENAKKLKAINVKVNHWTLWIAHSLGIQNTKYILGESDVYFTGLLSKINLWIPDKKLNIKAAKAEFVNFYTKEIQNCVGSVLTANTNKITGQPNTKNTNTKSYGGISGGSSGSSGSSGSGGLGGSGGNLNIGANTDETKYGTVGNLGPYNGPIPARNGLVCPNKSEHGMRKATKGIVLHRTAGSSYTPNYDPKCTKGVNAHFTIEKNGTLWIDAREDRIAWHAGVGNWNKYSIGIEIVGEPNRKTGRYVKITKAQAKTLAALVKYLVNKYNLGPGNVVAHYDIKPSKGWYEAVDARAFVRAVLKGQSVEQAYNSVIEKGNSSPERTPSNVNTLVDSGLATVKTGSKAGQETNTSNTAQNQPNTGAQTSKSKKVAFTEHDQGAVSTSNEIRSRTDLAKIAMETKKKKEIKEDELIKKEVQTTIAEAKPEVETGVKKDSNYPTDFDLDTLKNLV